MWNSRSPPRTRSTTCTAWPNSSTAETRSARPLSVRHSHFERAGIDRFPEDVGVEVQRVSDHQRRAETLAGRLTARQFEAMETARELGYYEVPRTASLADVAAVLDCSENAASTLLRTVESELVDAALGR